MSWLLSYFLPNRVVVSESTTGASSSRVFSIKDMVESNIKKYDVIIFSKSYCPYCIRAKEAIQSQGVNFGVLELDLMNYGDEIQAELHKMTGQRTVPNIFVKGKHLGGCDDTLAAIQTGKFAKMLL